MERKTVNLEIKGMTCEGSAETVKRHLRQVEGVQDAVIDWEGERGEVIFDPAKTDEGTILRSPAFRRGHVPSSGVNRWHHPRS